MSTTDTRCTDFEAWAIRENYAFYSESERRVLFYGVSGTRNAIQKAWDAGMAQAATEAAKATGTAGELPPLPVPKDIAEHGMFRFNSDQMREYGQACAEAALAKVYAIAVEEKAKMDAEAARQPAPVVAVKTWQERCTEAGDAPINGIRATAYEKAKDAEIAELRAALAATQSKQRAAHCPNCGANGEHICPAGSQP